MGGFAGDLSSFSADVAPDFAPSYGGGYNLGVDLQPAATPNIQSSITLPNAPETPPTPGYQRALDVVGKAGTGLEKEFTDSPLKALSGALGLGATGFGIGNQISNARTLNQQTQQISKQQKAASAAAAPAVEFGKEQLAAGQAGKLPGPQEAAIEQWKQQAKADMRARLASMGLGNSTDLQSEEAKIDLMGESMKAELLQGQEKLGLEGLQTGVSAASAGAATAGQQQQLLTNLISGANQQLAKIAATNG